MAESPKIVYTGITATAAVKKSITSLGGFLGEDIKTSTHLVSDQVKRTMKFLCAIGRGTNIVSEDWVKKSKTAKEFLDAEEFTIRDAECEKKYRFSLADSISRVRDSGPFLSGWSIYVSGKCDPKPAQLKEIIGMYQPFLVAK